ncbi:hypothetical protein [Embleya sp. NPDC020630]|uniref:hypothetical protein n=1 Tax=Embleya sp. NPDC020630 TaxID=3363979 RepID=UPI0037B23629
MDPVAPTTENGRLCLRWTVDGGGFESDLSAATLDGRGGFALVHGTRRAEFTDLHGTYAPGDPRAHAVMTHDGARIDTLTTPSNDIAVSASGIDVTAAPSLLTSTAATAIAEAIPNSPLRAEDRLFDLDLHVEALPSAPLYGLGGEPWGHALCAAGPGWCGLASTVGIRGCGPGSGRAWRDDSS